jgi:two-component system, NarL family, response regulator DegU
MKSVLTVFIADDHPMFVKGVRSALEKSPAIRIVGEAHDGVSAWESIQKLRPNIAILDVDMPGLNGLQIARRLSRLKLPVRLVMLTMHKKEDLFRQAIDLGVLGYLLKDDMASDVVQCLKTVSEGKHFITPALSSFLVRLNLDTSEHGVARMTLDELSPTQREVLKLVAEGLTSKDIAVELGISFRTVENHRFRIVEKLGLKGTNSLLRFALQNRAEL